ncbi:MAG: MATE family efflux transporter [Candidatus Margulisbacteria bacterium]|jgi:putative MATE family efflux protein|nr:MATE family efflux transporter [Candidatus Margulisiibacteriota bacterium]
MIGRFYRRFTRERDLTSGSLPKAIWILAIPMMLGNMLQAAFNLVDMIWVGRLGPDALAAVSMSGSILMVLMFVMIGVGVGTTALVARSIGAKEKAKADHYAMQSLLLGLIGSAVFGLIGYFLSPLLLALLGADRAVAALGTGYMQIMFIGVVVMFFMFLISAVLQGAGDALTPMIILAISVLLNIVLDPLLIFGIGFPKMGVNGAAWATVIAEGIGSLVALEVLLRGRSRVHVRLADFRVDWGAMGRILSIGLPASVQMSLRGLMGIALITIVARFGMAAVAAYGVVLRINMIAMMPGFALANAAGTLVGQNLGAKKPERAVASSWLALGYYLLITLLLGVLFFVFPEPLMLIFNDQAGVVTVGVELLRYTAVGLPFLAVGLVLGRAINGSGDSLPTAFFTLVALWFVQVPLAFYLAGRLGLTGIWVAILIAQVVLALLNYGWFQTGFWQRKAKESY